MKQTIWWSTWFCSFTFLSAVEVTTMPFKRMVLHKVLRCPLSEREWRKASIRLKCNQDKSNTSYRYHCLPDSMLTMLVEFCYNDARPLFPKGNCATLDTMSATINGFNCTHFEYGCPMKYFDTDEIYKYPDCLLVDLHNNCFRAEKRCRLQKRHHIKRMTKKTFRNQIIYNDSFPSRILSYYHYYYDSGKLFTVTILICICASAIFLFVREHNKCKAIRIIGTGCVKRGETTVLCAKVLNRYMVVNWFKVNPKSNEMEKINLNHPKYRNSYENILVINNVENLDLTTYQACIGEVSHEIKLEIEDTTKTYEVSKKNRKSNYARIQ